jgi:acyl-CoA thioesterase I
MVSSQVGSSKCQKMKFIYTRIAIYGIVFMVVTASLFFATQISRPSVPVVSNVASTAAPTSTEVYVPKAGPRIIVAFGDSITAGYGITIPEAYPQILEDALIAKGENVGVINSGVSGETTAGGLRRAPFVAAQKPDFVIIALGGNDVLRGIDPAETKTNLAGIITIFQAEDIHIVLAGMKAPTNLGPAYVRAFDALYPELANQYNIPLVPFLLEGVALEPSLNQADGIHPNPEGAKIIAEKNVLPILLPLL